MPRTKSSGQRGGSSGRRNKGGGRGSNLTHADRVKGGENSHQGGSGNNNQDRDEMGRYE